MKKASSYMSDEFIYVFHKFEDYATRVDKKKSSTLALYWGNICALCDNIQKDFLDITLTDAETYFHTLVSAIGTEAGLSRKTIHNRLMSARSIGRYIELHLPEYHYTNPFRLLDVPIPESEEQINPNYIPSLEELDTILTVAKEEPMYFLIIALASRIGLTASGIARLTVQHIHSEDDGILYLQNIASKQPVFIALPPDVANILISYISTLTYQDNEGHLFYNKHKHPITIRNMDAYLLRIQRKLGFEHTYSMKDLRSRAILDMAATGAEAQDIKEYTGLAAFRLRHYQKAASLIGICPANLVNYQLKDSMISDT